MLKSVVIEGKKGISGRICFSEVLRNFIRYFQAPSKFLKFDSEKSFSQNQSVFSAIFLKVPSSFSDLFCHGFRALWARRLSFQYSLGLQIFLGCIFIPNQGMQRDKIHLWNGIQKNVFIWALDSDEKHTIESLFRKVRNQDDRQVDAESLGCCTGALVVELGDNGQWRNCPGKPFFTR